MWSDREGFDFVLNLGAEPFTTNALGVVLIVVGEDIVVDVHGSEPFGASFLVLGVLLLMERLGVLEMGMSSVTDCLGMGFFRYSRPVIFIRKVYERRKPPLVKISRKSFLLTRRGIFFSTCAMKVSLR